MTEAEHEFSYKGNEYLAFARFRNGRIIASHVLTKPIDFWYSSYEPYNRPNSIPARVAEAFFAGIEAKEQAQ